ncbi:MAG TPA: uracil-DNA glycosylase family protein [Candidatus Limnocylindrales bacterium]
MRRRSRRSGSCGRGWATASPGTNCPKRSATTADAGRGDVEEDPAAGEEPPVTGDEPPVTGDDLRADGSDPSGLEHSSQPGHRATLIVDGLPVETLADIAPEPGRLLFVGLNPSPVSVSAGHYQQGRLGRLFWRRLAGAAILPADVDLAVADDALAAAGHGITDLIKAVTPRDVASDTELRAGVGPLWQRIALWRPAAVVFIYKRAAETAAGRPLRESWGQLDGVALGGRPCFLMPGPYAPREEAAEGVNFLRNLGASLPR